LPSSGGGNPSAAPQAHDASGTTVSASLEGAEESLALDSALSLVVVTAEPSSEVDVCSAESRGADVVLDVGSVEEVVEEVLVLAADEVVLDAAEVFDVEGAGPGLFEVDVAPLDVVCEIELVLLVLPALLDMFGDVPPLEHAPSKLAASNAERYERKFASVDDGRRTKLQICWKGSMLCYLVLLPRQRGGTILTPEAGAGARRQ
jgi:hypothetical protein